MLWETRPEVDQVTVMYAWLKENHLEEPRTYSREDHYDRYWDKFMSRYRERGGLHEHRVVADQAQRFVSLLRFQ